MNFDWLPEFKRVNGCPWAGSDFYKYGLSESEALYAWTLVKIEANTLGWVREILSSSKDQVFGIEDTWIETKAEQVIFSEPLISKSLEYRCSREQFFRNLRYWEENGL